MKFLTIILFSIILTSCSTLNNAIDIAGDANDKAIKATKESQCRAFSVGSIMREFNTVKKAKLWCDWCEYQTGFCSLTP